MEYGMFGAIAQSAKELKCEADRVNCGAEIEKAITTGELQKILDHTKHSVRELKKITFKSQSANSFLEDPEFVEAVESIVNAAR